MVKKVAHIGNAVKNLKEASQRLHDLLGARESHAEWLSSENVDVMLLHPKTTYGVQSS